MINPTAIPMLSEESHLNKVNFKFKWRLRKKKFTQAYAYDVYGRVYGLSPPVKGGKVTVTMETA